MAVTDSAELLFTVSADTSDAEANMQHLRTALGRDLSDATSAFADQAVESMGRTQYSVGEAGHALMGLGELLPKAIEKIHELTPGWKQAAEAEKEFQEQVSGSKQSIIESIEASYQATDKMREGARRLYQETRPDLGQLADAQRMLRQAAEAAQGPRHVEPVRTDQTADAMRREIAATSEAEQKAEDAFLRESQANERMLNRIVHGGETARERLATQYQQDLDRYSGAEEEKAAAAGRAAGKEEEVHEQYARIRTALAGQYNKDLQALENSEAWQGVFGSKFKSLLTADQSALINWATTSKSAFDMVRLSVTALDNMGSEAFEHLADGMGQNIASAIIYSKSIGAAMRAALAATLESIAAESIVQAIYATALGFLDLAEGDFAGAEAAFTAAAIFGTVGGAAAVAGRFAAGGSQGGAGSAQGRAGSAAGSSAPGGSTPASTPLGQGPGVHVYVQGNLVGWNNIDELTQAINDAVLNRDVTLTATNTTSGVQVVR